MRSKWLNHQNNDKLIVFFNGWGMDEKIVSSLDCSGYDVLTFCDYRDLTPPSFDFSAYKNKYLIAWSMGVYACNLFYNLFKDFDKFIAVNGTLKPIDDNYGIPCAVYDLMIKNFNELTCEKFMSKITKNTVLKEYSARKNDELLEELILMRDLKADKFFRFDKAVISLKDRIMPANNQLKYWETTGCEIVRKGSSHYIFDEIDSWKELL